MTEENDDMIEHKKEEETKQEEPKVKWAPVAHLDPFEDAPEEVKLHHRSYVDMWLTPRGSR